jgi:DNA-binding response OmpR family regulator
MRAALKRQHSGGSVLSVLQAGDLTIDLPKREVEFRGEPIRLTKREFDLLSYLVENHDVVCSRDRLMEKVWGYGFSGGTNLVDVYVRYLRNKIDYRFHQEIIRTVRSVGYIVKL